MLRDNISGFETQALISAVKNVLASDEREFFEDMVADGASTSDVFEYIADGVYSEDDDEDDYDDNADDTCGDPNCDICNDVDELEDWEDDGCGSPFCPECNGVGYDDEDEDKDEEECGEDCEICYPPNDDYYPCCDGTCQD